jgi:hypothetical protein
MIRAPDPPRKGPPFWSIAAITLLPVTLIAGCSAGAGMIPAWRGLPATEFPLAVAPAYDCDQFTVE